MGIVYTRHPSLDDQLRTAAGYVSWNFHPILTSASFTPTSQTIYATAVPFRAGQVVTNLVWQLNTAAVGAGPTGMFVGLCNATTMLAQSGNLKDDACWLTTGHRQAALSAAYTIPADGIYWAVLLQNGTFASTQPAFGRTSNGLGNANYAIGTAGTVFVGTLGTAQTALPANAAAVTFTVAAGAAGMFVGAS